jgi:aminoglycoside phosphotransferase (APT) family kinase protein
MDAFPTSLRPLEGGDSGETFLAEVAGEEVVLRVYGLRSAPRGPLAPEIDAAVLELVRSLLPVPDVLEVRRGDPDADLPGLLVTSFLSGERLDLVLRRLDRAQQAVVGAHLGTLVGRLGHMVQPLAGTFTDRTLVPRGLPEHLRELPLWVDVHADRLAHAWSEPLVEKLRQVAEDAQDLVDDDPRVCLVHADLNAPNLLVDPATLEVTGVLDWEFAHLGSPYADLGNLLRFEREPDFLDAVLTAYRDFMPSAPDDLLDRARAADLFALVELAAQQDRNETVTRARTLLHAIAKDGDPHATPG